MLQAELIPLVRVQKIRMLVGMWTVKTVFMNLQVGMRTLGSWIRGHLCDMLAKKFATVYPCSKTLREAEFKGDRLINLAEEI
jgi:hypothetical protein